MTPNPKPIYETTDPGVIERIRAEQVRREQERDNTFRAMRRLLEEAIESTDIGCVVQVGWLKETAKVLEAAWRVQL